MIKLSSITAHILDIWHRRNSRSYIAHLRSLGIRIGDGCIFRDPLTTRIDVSRPALVSIGSNVDMNTYFQILTHDWASFVFRNKYHDFVNSSGRVEIGSNIYIGTNVIVLRGVTIGDNCVIGAGSVVTHDIPANSVAVGAPGRVVCSLDEYYQKRKVKGLQEAVEHVKAFQKNFGRDPLPHELYEEFIYFVDASNVEEYERQGVPVRSQLSIAYGDWLSTHKAKFSSYDDFIQYVNQKMNETAES